MNWNNPTVKIITIGAISMACFVASLMVMGLVNERQNRYSEAKKEIASKWSSRQTLVGPILVSPNKATGIDHYVLPNSLHYSVRLEPQTRYRGIFKTVVYSSVIEGSGNFLATDIVREFGTGSQNTKLAIVITDTKGIEKQLNLTWNGTEYPFNPGPGFDFDENSGLHTTVPTYQSEKIPFTFTIALKGSEGVSIAPLGRETSFHIESLWKSPKFVGNFLPSNHEINNGGFVSDWNISSFGRSYPQSWSGSDVTHQQIIESAAGVDLLEQIDMYDMVFRSIKYAILFIITTFAVFFLFDVLVGIRIHPIQYTLVGTSLALFYLLLLSLSEQIGFGLGYLAATTLITLLITGYSSFILKNKKRAYSIFALLVVLYGYLYFVLQLEDYALLFGSFLVFVLLAVVMYTTRNIDWFNQQK